MAAGTDGDVGGEGPCRSPTKLSGARRIVKVPFSNEKGASRNLRPAGLPFHEDVCFYWTSHHTRVVS